MNNAVGIALLAGGIVLLIFGINAANSAGSEFSKFFTGNPTDKSMWMIIGGAVATGVGLISLLRGRSRP
jgi:hypothetical protein